MLSDIDHFQSRMTPDVLSTFDAALQGCTLTLSVVEDELNSLLIEGKDGDRQPKRLKYLLDYDHLDELLGQLRGQQTGVCLLLQTYQM